MAKALNEWIFIIVGLVVIAISIYFYDTLKIFIAIGGFMCLYGLGKMSYNKFKNEMFPKEEDEPVDLNKVPNPYMQKTPQHITHHKPVQTTPAAAMHKQHIVHQRPIHSPVQRVQPSAAKYCHSCGKPVHSQHRFCSSCGARLQQNI